MCNHDVISTIAVDVGDHNRFRVVQRRHGLYRTQDAAGTLENDSDIGVRRYIPPTENDILPPVTVDVTHCDSSAVRAQVAREPDQIAKASIWLLKQRCDRSAADDDVRTVVAVDVANIEAPKGTCCIGIR